jgi:hypothetical protein
VQPKTNKSHENSHIWTVKIVAAKKPECFCLSNITNFLKKIPKPVYWWSTSIFYTMQGNGCYSSVWWNCKREVWMHNLGHSKILPLHDHASFVQVLGFTNVFLSSLGMVRCGECCPIWSTTWFWEKTRQYRGSSLARVSPWVIWVIDSLMVCPMRLPVLPTLQAIKYMPFMFYTSANRLVPLHLIQEFSKLPISLSQLYSTERESMHLILILLCLCFLKSTFRNTYMLICSVNTGSETSWSPCSFEVVQDIHYLAMTGNLRSWIKLRGVNRNF